MERSETLARSALRWDGAYCIVMGMALAVFFAPTAAVLEAPKPLIAIGGIATVVWGSILAIASSSRKWRPPTIAAVVANLAAATALVGVAMSDAVDSAGRLVLLGITIQVLGFAATQAHAVWSPWRR